MGFWSRWFGKKAPPPPPEEPPSQEAPAPAAALPSGPVDLGDGLTIQAHILESPRAIEAISGGLSALGQVELIMAVRLYEDDNTLEVFSQLATFFRTIGHFARQGMLVTDGGFSEFGPEAPFSSRIGGVTYATEGDRLRAVLLDRAEIAVVKSTSAHRILTRLGAQARHFPFPPASDLRRPSVAQADEESVLNAMPVLKIQGLFAAREGDFVHLSVSEEAGQYLHQVLSGDQGGAILTDPDPGASQRLVWHPGQTSPSGIVSPEPTNSRACGWFILMAPVQTESEVRLMEDGFGLLLGAADWESLRTALAAGQPLTIPGETLGLQLSWRGSAAEHHPQTPASGPTRKQVHLISPQESFEKALPQERLGMFITDLFSAVEASLDAMTDPETQVRLQVSLFPSKPPAIKVQLVPEQKPPQALWSRIGAVDVPEVSEPVVFQVLLNVQPVVH